MAFGSANTSTGGSGNATCVGPAGIVAGETIVYAVAGDSSALTVGFPTGFTSTSTKTIAAPDGQGLAYALKIATGAEANSTMTATLSANGGWAAFIARYTGRETTQPRNVAGSNSNTSSNTTPVNISTASITTTTDACDILQISCTDALVSTAFTPCSSPAFTERVDVNNGGFASISLSDMNLATAGATGVITQQATFGGGGGSGWITYLFALSPAPSGAANRIRFPATTEGMGSGGMTGGNRVY